MDFQSQFISNYIPIDIEITMITVTPALKGGLLAAKMWSLKTGGLGQQIEFRVH